MSRANDTVHPYEVVKHYYGGGMEETSVPGITLREHFAAMAMQGLLASGANEAHANYEWLSNRAVTCADLLIAELAK